MVRLTVRAFKVISIARFSQARASYNHSGIKFAPTERASRASLIKHVICIENFLAVGIYTAVHNSGKYINREAARALL